MAAKEIRSLNRVNERTGNTEMFYPATTTDSVADRTRQKSLADVLDDLEDNSGAYDISAANNNTKYADLAAALGTNGANVPATVRKGGMSVKFVLTSDNKYVCYRYMGISIGDTYFTNVSYWEEVVSVKVLSISGSSDLDVSDEQGNVIVRFTNGHVKVKNFDSADNNNTLYSILKYTGIENIPEFDEEENYDVGDVVKYNKLIYKFTSEHEAGTWDLSEVEETNIFDELECPVGVETVSSDADLDFVDNNGYVILRLKDGHIQTKNFDSNNPDGAYTSEELAMLDAARVKIVNKNEENKLLNFAFITDTHADGLYQPTYRNANYNLKLFKRFCNEKLVDFAAHGGDIYTDYCLDRSEAISCIDSVTAVLGEIGVPVYYAKGNHDGNGKSFPKADMDNLDWEHNTYYEPHASGDVIGLMVVTESNWDGHTQLFTSNVADINEMITNTQFYLLTEDNISVIHNPNAKYAGYFYKDFDDENIRLIVINAYEVPTQQQGTGNTNWDAVGISREQVDWFVNTAINTDKNVIVVGHIVGTAITALSSHFLDVEQHGGKFIAYIHGHGHTDSSSTSQGYLDIGVTRGYGNNPSQKYYAFSVFSVDVFNGKLYETRIGSGNDREYNIS